MSTELTKSTFNAILDPIKVAVSFQNYFLNCLLLAIACAKWIIKGAQSEEQWLQGTRERITLTGYHCTTVWTEKQEASL